MTTPPSAKNMKAMRIHAFTNQSHLTYEDAPLPTLNKDDVLIRVHAAGVNPIDWKVCAGTHPLAAKMELPLIPGWDVAGTIEAVGSAVTNFKVGEAVFAKPDHFRQGAYAEFIAVRAVEVAPKPASISFVEAASLPLVALTTWQALILTAQLQQGQRILIHGAAGGIGSFAVQLAKAKGAYVIGTGSANNQAFIAELGADEFIDYNNTDFEALLKDASQKVDVVYDTVGNAAGETQSRSWSVLKEGGFLVSIVRPEPDKALAEQYKVGSALVVVSPSGEQLAEIAKLVDAGAIKPIVSVVLPLADALEAHALNKTGHTRGKIVLQVV